MKTNIPFLPLIALLNCSVILSANAVSPPLDGGYPGSNTAEGQNALFNLTSGGYNTAVGFFSLSATNGNFNTGIGAGTLLSNTGNENTATGAGALFSNSTGAGNTADGSFALFSNTTGTQNLAVGWHALQSNVIGSFNTAIGFRALVSNTADNNTATGIHTLIANTVGTENTADGGNALQNNMDGNDNTADGFNALLNNVHGTGNTAIGSGALNTNTDSVGNTAVGDLALGGNTTGSNNVALGEFAGLNQTTGSNNVYIGSVLGVAGEGSACYIMSIFGQTSAGGVPVFINSTNKLGTTTSSKRFKEEIKPMANASEVILGLKPVTFRYKKQIDPQRIQQFGLVAEEVEKVNPDLVVRDKEGKPYSVRYDQVNAMLLNEFLKEHRTVQEQGATIARLQKQIEALTAGLEKVNARLELSRSAP